MLEIVSSHDVKLGMFVVELDRPWLGTPFALQGFLVSNPRQIAALQEYCSFVSVDRAKSVQTQFRETPTPLYASAAGRGRALIETFRAVSAMAGSAGSVPAPGVAHCVSVEDKASLPARAATAPSARAAQAAPEERRRTISATGRMERVAQAAKRPNLQPNREPFADLVRVVSEPQPGLPQIPRQTIYIDQSSVEEEMLASGEAFGRTQELLLDVSLELAKNRLPQPERIRGAVDDMVQSIVRNPDAMIWLSKLKRSDNYSYDHALDVSVHVMAFGRHLGFPPDQLNILGVAGLLQDVGKTRVPLGLLQQTNPLTPAERAVLRRHVEFSTQILAAQPDISPQVLEIVARHHERYDGSGYPQRLSGQDIGVLGEMAGLVDTYCAVCYDRPYRRGLDNQQALRKLYASRGRRFTEALIIEFIQCIGLYPVGTLVELRSGEVAVVVEQNRIRRLKPRVLVLLDSDKRVVAAPFTLDLKDEPLAHDGTVCQIRCALAPGAYGIEPREFYL